MTANPSLQLAGLRVLVTGHTGFTGSWMSHWLLESGAEIAGYALAPTPDTELNLFVASGLADRMEGWTADIRDLDTLSQRLNSFRPDVLIHLAAQPIVRASYKDPEETYSTNVMGTLNVLQAAHRAGVRRVVNITSDKAYENREWIWGYRESDPLGGHDMYSSSKACADILARSFWLSFCQGDTAMEIVTARAGNIIGGGDWGSDRLVPDIARAAAANNTVTIRSPNAIRPWQHVLEAVRAYLLLATTDLPADLAGGAVNFGPPPESHVSVGELAGKMCAAMAHDGLEINPDDATDHEAGLLRLDASLARQRLGWRPALDIDETIAMTANFYRALIDKPASARGLMEADLAAYCRRLD